MERTPTRQAKASGRKRFFFKKKKQKTFADWSSLYPERPGPKIPKVFCFFFSKKKTFLSLSHCPARVFAP
jgi:hypothetical protein